MENLIICECYYTKVTSSIHGPEFLFISQSFCEGFIDYEPTFWKINWRWTTSKIVTTKCYRIIITSNHYRVLLLTSKSRVCFHFCVIFIELITTSAFTILFSYLMDKQHCHVQWVISRFKRTNTIGNFYCFFTSLNIIAWRKTHKSSERKLHWWWQQ